MASWLAFHLQNLFTFGKQEAWLNWIQRSERFRDASGLDEKEETKQISPLIYSMGDEVEDVLQSFWLIEEEQELYTAVRNKFTSFFIKRRTIVLNNIGSIGDAKKSEKPQNHL